MCALRIERPQAMAAVDWDATRVCLETRPPFAQLLLRQGLGLGRTVALRRAAHPLSTRFTKI
jgi:hypothetical protein